MNAQWKGCPHSHLGYQFRFNKGSIRTEAWCSPSGLLHPRPSLPRRRRRGTGRRPGQPLSFELRHKRSRLLRPPAVPAKSAGPPRPRSNDHSRGSVQAIDTPADLVPSCQPECHPPLGRRCPWGRPPADANRISITPPSCAVSPISRSFHFRRRLCEYPSVTNNCRWCQCSHQAFRLDATHRPEVRPS